MKNGSQLSNKAYSILNFIPTVVFAIFAGLMVVFTAILPVAKVNAFGLNENYGSILSGTKFDEIAGLNNLSIILLVVCLITIIYAVTLLINRFSVLRYRKLFGKPLYKFLEVISIVFILVYLLFAIVIIGKINVADEGLGIIRVDSYAILTIILSVVCLLAVVISIGLCYSYEKSNPEILEVWKEERQKLKTEGKTSKAKKVANKAGQRFAKYFILPIIVFAVILGSNKGISNIVQRFEGVKPFNASDLKQVLVKDAGAFAIGKSTIEFEIGQSSVLAGATENEHNVVYYTDNYIGLLGKIERNQKYALLAIEQGDYRISGLLKQAKNLELEQEILAYGKAEIVYNDHWGIR